VTAADQPELFDEIDDVAEATGGPMPQEVYIAADLNAGVATSAVSSG
jgi:hypothetical protein